jgi:cytochrome c553
MKKFLRLLGATVILLVVLGALGILFAYSGLYNVAATTGHSKPLEQIFRVAMMRSVVAHARKITPPADFQPQDRELAEHAAGHFEAMCRTCHGAPGKKPDPWQLYPPAPDLADALRVTRWSDAEVFWIIKNGLKDTGMSAFGASHSDDDLWALTAFVRQLPSITPEAYQQMREHGPAHQPMESGEKSERASAPSLTRRAL